MVVVFDIGNSTYVTSLSIESMGNTRTHLFVTECMVTILLVCLLGISNHRHIDTIRNLGFNSLYMNIELQNMFNENSSPWSLIAGPFVSTNGPAFTAARLRKQQQNQDFCILFYKYTRYLYPWNSNSKIFMIRSSIYLNSSARVSANFINDLVLNLIKHFSVM